MLQFLASFTSGLSSVNVELCTMFIHYPSALSTHVSKFLNGNIEERMDAQRRTAYVMHTYIPTRALGNSQWMSNLSAPPDPP